MKLIDSFNSFLDNYVNLNQTRVEKATETFYDTDVFSQER